MNASRKVALLTGALAIGSASLGLLPVAVAAEPALTVPPAVEAWYQPNPSCASVTGCLPIEGLATALPSAFPAGTLHVGVTAGAEAARTFLGVVPDVVQQPLSAASLTVPLDVSPTGGSLLPDTAKAIVCVTRAQLVPAQGSYVPPPAADCATAVPLTYVATPAPHLQADLLPLLPALRKATGLVLLPDATKVSGADAWRAVFSATTREGSGITPSASLSLTPTGATASPSAGAAPTKAVPVTATTASSPTVPDAVAPPLAVLPDLDELGQPVASPAGPVPVLAAAPAEVVLSAADSPAVALPETRLIGYAYPGVWLLPLVLLVLVPLIARTLTADLRPSTPSA